MFSHSVKIAFFCLVTVLAATAEESGDDGGRIVGGQATTIDRVPYLLQLRYAPNGLFLCGATLLTPRHALTAAHCFSSSSPLDTLVVGGASTTFETGVQRTVVQYFKHPRYNIEYILDFDVAVLVLNAPMSGPSIRTVELPTQRVSVGQYMQVSGWGYTSENDKMVSERVRTVFVPVISQSQCIAQNGITTISNRMLCASEPGTKDACNGDSGGPAIAGNKVVGIVSWGSGCGRATNPGVYTDVVAVLPFINQCLKY